MSIGIIGRISRLVRELEPHREAVYRQHGLEPGWHDVLGALTADERRRVADLLRKLQLGLPAS